MTTPRETRLSGATIFWAVTRIIFGVLQMTGAIASAALLFREGASKATIVACSLTMGVTLISITLFRWLKLQERGASISVRAPDFTDTTPGQGDVGRQSRRNA